MKQITVADLIAFLQTKPQNLPVAYQLYSEAVLLELHKISIEKLGEPRSDGWVSLDRPNKPTQEYLVFPGN